MKLYIYVKNVFCLYFAAYSIFIFFYNKNIDKSCKWHTYMCVCSERHRVADSLSLMVDVVFARCPVSSAFKFFFVFLLLSLHFVRINNREKVMVKVQFSGSGPEGERWCCRL